MNRPQPQPLYLTLVHPTAWQHIRGCTLLWVWQMAPSTCQSTDQDSPTAQVQHPQQQFSITIIHPLQAAMAGASLPG